jgi:hypothetical protein
MLVSVMVPLGVEHIDKSGSEDLLISEMPTALCCSSMDLSGKKERDPTIEKKLIINVNRRVVKDERIRWVFLDWIAPKRLYSCLPGCSAVGSAPRLGRGGRRFESAHPDQLLIKIHYMMASKKTIIADLIIEAAHYKPNGQIDSIRAYERRGKTYSDCTLYTLNDLLDLIQKGKQVVVGQRVPHMASTFINTIPSELLNKSGQLTIVNDNRSGDRGKPVKIPAL